MRRALTWPQSLLASAVVAVLYVGLAKLSWTLAALPGNVSPVWPSAGLAVAAVVLGGKRLAIGVYAGELLANALTGLPWWVAGLMAAGNVAEAVVAQSLLDRFAFDPRVQRTRDVVTWLLCAAGIAPLVGAVCGVGALNAGGIVPDAAALHSALTWWAGDALGIVIVGTTICVAFNSCHPFTGSRRRLLLEAIGGFAALEATTAFAFHSREDLSYLVFPIVVLGALRLTQRGACLSMLAVSIVAVHQTSVGHGAFAGMADPSDQLWRLDGYLTAVTVTALLLASVVVDRDRARTKLASRHDELEAAVQERTAALVQERARLSEAQRVGQIGSWEWHIPTNTLVWSEQLYRLFGVDSTTFEASYEHYMELVHPDDREAMQAHVDRAYNEHLAFEQTHRLAHDTGATPRWIRSHGQVSLDSQGNVERLSGTAQDVTAYVELQSALEHQARHDDLTGLPNRELFAVTVQHALRSADGIAVMFLDLDRFKWINDSLGHAIGDEVLAIVAKRLRASVRPSDVVARFGGDEFAILCHDLEGSEAAVAVAERALAALHEPLRLQGHDLPIGASIGIAVATPSHVPDQLLREADAAMYAAKASGGSRFELFDEEMFRRAQHRLETTAALQHALEQGRVVPAYQPIVDLVTQEPVGVEALARWHDDVRGWIPPVDFIEVAEQSGLIVLLGDLILRQACNDLAALNKDREVPLWLSVNVSAAQLEARDFVERVAWALDEAELDASLLTLELTETALMEDVASISASIAGLKQLGIRLSVDDFGTGYSSLLYLRRFPVSGLKIDRSFVSGLPSSADDAAIVMSVVDLAHGLGLNAIAEGVETAEQLLALRADGCDFGQGFLWSAAHPLPGLRTWLEERPVAGIIAPRTPTHDSAIAVD